MCMVRLVVPVRSRPRMSVASTPSSEVSMSLLPWLARQTPTLMTSVIMLSRYRLDNRMTPRWTDSELNTG